MPSYPSQRSQKRQPSSKDKFTPAEIAAQFTKSLKNLPIKKVKSVRRSVRRSIVPIANALLPAANAVSRIASHYTRSKRGGSGKKRKTSRRPPSARTP